MKMKSTANAFADSLVRQGASKETVCSYCKSVELFYSQYGEVTVDHLLAYKAYLLEHYAVNTVNARGFGKFQLAEVGGVTKKGRTAIVVKRYV